MPSKRELCDKLNTLLGLTVDFEPMSKEDLEALVKLVEDPSNLVKLGLEGLRQRGKKEVVDRFEKVTKRPLIDTLKALQDAPAEDKGILGLGILPRIMARRGEAQKDTRDANAVPEPPRA